MHTDRMPGETEGRRGDDAAEAKEPKMASQPPEARREAWIRFPLGPQKESALLKP